MPKALCAILNLFPYHHMIESLVHKCVFSSLTLERLIYHMLLVKPLEDPHKTTDIILEALKDTGQRGIIDRGWGDLGNRKFHVWI